MKELEYNNNINNINGVFKIGTSKYFYKILNKNDFLLEQSGYKKMRKCYNVSRLISIDEVSRIVIYEYNENHQKNKGLLVDFFSSNDCLNKDYYELFTDYISVFNKTIKYTKKGNCKIFFENRLKTRLRKNVEFVEKIKLDNRFFKLNNKTIEIRLSEMESNINRYFNTLKKEWCVISNSDPNDLNICMDKTLFDYTGGGEVPIIAEFAVFTCYNLIQSEYLSLRYNRKAFKKHKKIYQKLNRCKIKRGSINHKPRNIRVDAIKFYSKNVIEPLLINANYLNWYEDFKYYFVMKLLAVFQFDKMSKKDILLSLSYAQLFFDAKLNSIDEFISFIKKIYE